MSVKFGFGQAVGWWGARQAGKLVALNLVISFAQAGWQEYQENKGLVNQDGMNMVQTTLSNFGGNVVWVAEQGYDWATAPE